MRAWCVTGVSFFCCGEPGLLTRLPALRVPPPHTSAGELDITYLDEEVRVSRGDKGACFAEAWVSGGWAAGDISTNGPD